MNHSSHKGILIVTCLSVIIFSSISLPKYILHLRQSARISSSSIDLINAVNSLRISHGLPVYQVNQTLMYIAQNHSDYQASIGTTTHYGADGSRPFQRALSAGYSVAGDLSMGGYFSENIISGNNLSAIDAVNIWQLDSPHLNTMLSASLQDIGAGVTAVGDMIYYTIDVGLSTSSGSVPTQFGEIFPTYYPVLGRKIITSTPGDDGSIFHIVEIGDTVWTIAQVYNVSQEELIQMNSLNSYFIYVGDKLLIRPQFSQTPTLPVSMQTTGVSHTPSPFQTAQPQKKNTVISPTAISNQKSPIKYNVVFMIIISLTMLSAGFFTFLGRREIDN